MLMRFEPYRGDHPMTEDLHSEHRLRQIPVDAYRRGDELKLHLDMPGVDPGSVELTVENDVLTVRGERTWTRLPGDQIQMAERAHGAFSRQLFLGESLERDHITAVYDDGVLSITIPVAEQAKPHRIEIIHAGGVVQQAAHAVAVAASVETFATHGAFAEVEVT